MDRRLSTSSEAAAHREIEETLHTTLYPGTEVMTDIGGLHFKHAGKNVLVPQPSDDPSDPLNWSFMWKMAIMLGMNITTFSWTVGPLAISSQVPYYMAEWNRSLSDVVQFVGVSILVLGFSNIIWVPIARAYGRRPMALLANLLNVASMIWRAEAKSYGSFLGACVLTGIACGPSETLPGMLVADVIFLHQRGLYMSLYLWVAWSGTLLGPVIAGVMSDRYGWRSFWWLCVAIAVFSTVFQVFLMPETRWGERHVVIAHDPVGEGSETNIEGDKNEARFEETIHRPTDTSSAHEIVVKLTGKPSRAQFSLWGKLDKSSTKGIIPALVMPFRLFTYPIVLWSSFAFAWAASMLVIINVTQSQAFAGPPWNMSATDVGYTNFGALVGVVLSLVIAGPLSDWVSAFLTRRNKGIREPEMRLVALTPFIVSCLLGGVLVAVGYQHQWSWEAIVIGGYALLGFVLPALSAISLTYSIDSYKPVAGEILVGATMVKNLWAYGMTKYFNNWIAEVGYIKPIMFDTALAIFFFLLAVPLFFVGKKFRGWTRNSAAHREI
ncbi:uncharacterized protein Z520_00594 [Fonsecaea multimorphosa CBS 102226]|uniref:Major facilitator superfamily (MFS) profile domain-containing protein n=1 Tax=Fonsecaea multimorphosa CBS 102226 TaxID=1442371 RepID=A0A0D2J3D9_9EURO|nr:uncharacterized protein Z520_00594 [Fonsecaea multimorphosa CBS 102226]KIY03902.1 hypothetical protein Z520_00594 [Fonsecaea multimorphosa CBS 102226]OAL32163.1 hypothetical protein AYO22_00613 [Fonsecaea multimorphosa]